MPIGMRSTIARPRFGRATEPARRCLRRRCCRTARSSTIAAVSPTAMYTPLVVSALTLADQRAWHDAIAGPISIGCARRRCRGSSDRSDRHRFPHLQRIETAGPASPGRISSMARRSVRRWRSCCPGCSASRRSGCAIRQATSRRACSAFRPAGARGAQWPRSAGHRGEAALLHFRGAFQNPAMFAPVTLPPLGAALLLDAAVAPRRSVSLADPVVAAADHADGVRRRRVPRLGRHRAMGGWRNWSQNVLNGPPLPAPPSFTGLALPVSPRSA